VTELLPCPFCGMPADVIEGEEVGRWTVWCCAVGCDSTVEMRGDTRAEAVTAWNTRAEAATLRARVREAEGAVAAAARVLTRIEWSGCDGYAMPRCPECGAEGDDPDKRRHDADCKLAAFILCPACLGHLDPETGTTHSHCTREDDTPLTTIVRAALREEGPR
jgi:hypothetical protein